MSARKGGQAAFTPNAYRPKVAGNAHRSPFRTPHTMHPLVIDSGHLKPNAPNDADSNAVRLEFVGSCVSGISFAFGRNCFCYLAH